MQVLSGLRKFVSLFCGTFISSSILEVFPGGRRFEFGSADERLFVLLPSDTAVLAGLSLAMLTLLGNRTAVAVRTLLSSFLCLYLLQHVLLKRGAQPVKQACLADLSTS